MQADHLFPIPLLADFVKVAAHYAQGDRSNVAMITLVGLERLGRFRWKSHDASRWARAFDPKSRDANVVAAFADALRRRPSESVEDLLARDDVGATFGEAAVYDAPIRFRYAISRIFSLIEWNVRLDLLRAFVLRAAEGEGDHTFVSFNYDLFVDRAISESCASWHWHCGYGFDVPYAALADPSSHGELAQHPCHHACQSRVRILKPHGSLNWLLPVVRPAAAMPFADGPTTVRVDQNGHPEYVASLDLWPRIDYPDGDLPRDVGLGIVPPLRRKDASLQILRRTRDEEFKAVRDADEAFVLGWSLPATDDDQRSLIRYAASLRAVPFKRVVVVNLNQPPEYFERVADAFLVENSSVETWNNGFEDYVEANAG